MSGRVQIPLRDLGPQSLKNMIAEVLDRLADREGETQT
jgi:hypothetical protein